ncbi:class I SAM-dependent methyltransferase [Stratiformator vulcanicus]|uniref:Methyltransferase type 11 domain-containing protein n=1 Tax=Stratiformator vulcanicus TaxID=2527980 RepID=A0A517R6I6_9PLAN|nr:class I SAM-dependent methyltransferase [Stratiformator vulcanicus]QDT39452.1 hypothetical protein Pan189_38600 [Stratiformator vulcanicus]
MSYRSANAAAYDRLVRSGSAFAKVATDEQCANPLATLDSRGWLPKSVEGLEVLCLAAGGGWQSILYASAGARVTVVDISDEMLALDRREAARRGLAVTAIPLSMDDLSSLEDSRFDIVHQPVSTCYVPDVEPVYSEVARVTKPDGLYISQHKTPTSLQVTHRTPQGQHVLGLEYYRETALPQTEDTSYRETGATEFLHRWDQIVGGLCRAGFVLEDLREPIRAERRAPVGSMGHRGRFVAPYVRLKARRVAMQEKSDGERRLWTP